MHVRHAKLRVRLRGLLCGPLGANPLGCFSFFHVHLFYLDVAGSPGNKNEDNFVLAWICVYEAQVDWFSREIDKLAAPYNAPAPEDVEFYASPSSQDGKSHGKT